VHHDICARLERFSADVTAGRSPRVMMWLPPQYGKTEIVGRRLPVYHMARNPGHAVVYGTYGQLLSDKVSRATRRNAEMGAADLGWNTGRLEDGAWTERYWEVGNRSSFNATSVGGALTGSPAHIMLLDDLLKDWEAATSDIQRESAWDWYTSVAYTRLAPGAGVLVMGTRWNEDDPQGRLLRAMKDGTGDTWEIISYPALAEADEIVNGALRRREGEPLHPQRYDLEDVLRRKAVLGSHKFAALYQQRPAPLEGGLFKREWFRFHHGLDRPTREYEFGITVDCTFKDSKHSDFVVMQAWAKSEGGGRFYLLDQIRRRMNYPATKAAFVTFCALHPQARLKLIEAKANGPALIDDLSGTVPGLVPFDPKDSKEARAQTVAPLFEAGNVYLPDPAHTPWVEEYIDEMTSFPTAAHDDQVDATTQILLRWSAPMEITAGWLPGRLAR